MMAVYGALPLCMTQDFWRGEGDLGYGPIGKTTDYESRRPVEIEADTPQAACEQVWQKYQNIDEGHLTPDGGRSLMVGDLVLLSENQPPFISVWKVASCGFEQVDFDAWNSGKLNASTR